MKHLWDGESSFGNPPKTYKTYANAVKAARAVLGDSGIRVIIAASADGRFFPVALGQEALSAGVHFHLCVA